MSKEVTVCLTSCNRWDLLKQTINSFNYLNTYPIKKFLITEDSVKPEMKEKILHNFGDMVELIYNEVNLGPYKSIDKMYSMVETEYIFHSEDDWRFDSNPNFMTESIDVLEERKDIHQVWIRKDIDWSWIEPDILGTTNNAKYRMVKCPHLGGWCGFSHNPGLRRKSDYDKMFPNGFAEFIKPNEKAVHTELACNTNAMNKGYRVATLINTSCVHIGGGGRSTIA